MDRVIKVTGKGYISVKPDVTRIDVTLSQSEASYDAAIRRSTAMTELLRVNLVKLGFDKKDIRTITFNLEANGNEVRYNHVLRLEFANDNKLLGQCIKAIVGSPAKPVFKLTYTIKDSESVKNLIIGKAVADARKKAEVLSQAAGISLGSIQTMEYDWDDMELVSRTEIDFGDDIYKNESSNFKLNIEPEDIEASDTVAVIWSIL